MPSACALGIFSGKIIFNFAFGTMAFAERSKRFFHERGCDGKMYFVSVTLLVKMAERNARRRSVLPKSKIFFP